jgi:hypothetical protein
MKKQLDPGSWAFEEQISGKILGNNTWRSCETFPLRKVSQTNCSACVSAVFWGIYYIIVNPD